MDQVGKGVDVLVCIRLCMVCSRFQTGVPGYNLFLKELARKQVIARERKATQVTAEHVQSAAKVAKSCLLPSFSLNVSQAVLQKFRI